MGLFPAASRIKMAVWYTNMAYSSILAALFWNVWAVMLPNRINYRLKYLLANSLAVFISPFCLLLHRIYLHVFMMTLSSIRLDYNYCK